MTSTLSRATEKLSADYLQIKTRGSYGFNVTGAVAVGNISTLTLHIR